LTNPAPRRRRNVKPWPVPGATREEKAKDVARSYRQLAQKIAAGRSPSPAGELYVLDQHWAEHGVHWLEPVAADLLSERDEWMTAPDLAHAIDRTRKDLYNWASRGHIQQRTGPDGTPEYNVGSVLDYHHKQRQKRLRDKSGCS
jgi:hypothetical protein